MTAICKPPLLPRYKMVADVIRNRIKHGDYTLKPFPSERYLAQELNVNFMTVRRSLQILEHEQLLIRQSNGRMNVKRASQGKKPCLNFGFLTPSSASGNVEIWRMAIEKEARCRSCSVRPVLYSHWDDPIIQDSLEGFDGVFINPIPDPIPQTIAHSLRKPEHPVVVVDEDFSVYGAPSIQLFPPAFVRTLLIHLESLGHRHIGCLNTQPNFRETQSCINQWRFWMSSRGYSGYLADHSVSPHGNPCECAYKEMLHLLGSPTRRETAWLCTTTAAALGAMRAMIDRGFRPGHDIAICSINGDHLSSMLNPPLTSLEPADPMPYIAACMEWMLQGGRNWKGPLLLKPNDVSLIVRESTQPGCGRGSVLSAPVKVAKTEALPHMVMPGFSSKPKINPVLVADGVD